MPEPQKIPSISVIDIKPVNGTTPLKAFVSVKIGKLIIHGFRIIQQPNQAAWVSVPQNEYTNREGKKSYSPVIELPEEWKEPLKNVVLDAWENQE